LQPSGDRYLRHGNCLGQPLDHIWEKISTQASVVKNKNWLSFFS
jgi:hypothetical protein